MFFVVTLRSDRKNFAFSFPFSSHSQPYFASNLIYSHQNMKRMYLNWLPKLPLAEMKHQSEEGKRNLMKTNLLKGKGREKMATTKKKHTQKWNKTSVVDTKAVYHESMKNFLLLSFHSLLPDNSKKMRNKSKQQPH